MGDIRYHERDKIVVHQPPTLTLTGQAAAGTAQVASFSPELITVEVDTPANAVLSLSLPHYPGWKAQLNNQPTEILRAYAGLIAVEIPAGHHKLTLVIRSRVLCPWRNNQRAHLAWAGTGCNINTAAEG